jgi:hypothetical protein
VLHACLGLPPALAVVSARIQELVITVTLPHFSFSLLVKMN